MMPGTQHRIPVLELRGVTKRYGAVQALADVGLAINASDVVALVGDNGAGKSTLVKIISGAGTADSGVIEFKGNLVQLRGPGDAAKLGIATVYQDLALCDNLDVVANLFLGQEATGYIALDEVEMERRTHELLAQMSVQIPEPRTAVASLSGGQRQSVAIARALLGEPSLIILDEPTAALGVAQTAQVLDLIERVRSRGHAVLLISHNLADVFAVADRVVVLRLGRNAGDFEVDKVTQEEVVAAITGASDNVVARRAARNGSQRETSIGESIQ
ncbi:ATP-binding cassette domain-containing protein [Demequina lutea]|uniref:D-xylose transport system ATP-binding protein n=1 Tax=Demequina lutea TaxID=431489 RepID=A0A7Y9ZF80_9MICO|nr:ATP-binding cassette domain-containing protein [Demequina lutea]NYI42865.1 D-xylose transport system ATP-binding protein [Demequina lutea]